MFFVDKAFPRIIKYQWNANKVIFFGKEEVLNSILINDEAFIPKVVSQPNGAKSENIWVDFVKNNKKESDFIIDTIEVIEHKKEH